MITRLAVNISQILSNISNFKRWSGRFFGTVIFLSPRYDVTPTSPPLLSAHNFFDESVPLSFQ